MNREGGFTLLEWNVALLLLGLLLLGLFSLSLFALRLNSRAANSLRSETDLGEALGLIQLTVHAAKQVSTQKNGTVLQCDIPGTAPSRIYVDQTESLVVVRAGKTLLAVPGIADARFGTEGEDLVWATLYAGGASRPSLSVLCRTWDLSTSLNEAPKGRNHKRKEPDHDPEQHKTSR